MSEHLATLLRSIAGGIAFVGLGGLAFGKPLIVSIILFAIAGIILLAVADARKNNDH